MTINLDWKWNAESYAKQERSSPKKIYTHIGGQVGKQGHNTLTSKPFQYAQETINLVWEWQEKTAMVAT